VHLLGVEGVEAVLVERRQRRDGRRQHRHRVRVPGKAVEEGPQVFVEHGVPTQLLVEGRQLRLGRQLPVDQQVADLQER
jgi:hypothetical protein